MERRKGFGRNTLSSQKWKALKKGKAAQVLDWGSRPFVSADNLWKMTQEIPNASKERSGSESSGGGGGGLIAKTPRGEKFLNAEQMLWEIIGGCLYGLGLEEEKVEECLRSIEDGYFRTPGNSSSGGNSSRKHYQPHHFDSEPTYEASSPSASSSSSSDITSTTGVALLVNSDTTCNVRGDSPNNNHDNHNESNNHNGNNKLGGSGSNYRKTAKSFSYISASSPGESTASKRGATTSGSNIEGLSLSLPLPPTTDQNNNNKENCKSPKSARTRSPLSASSGPRQQQNQWRRATDRQILVFQNVEAYSAAFLHEQRNLRALILAQSVVRGWLQRRRYKKLAKLYIGAPLGKRNNAFQELVRTEKQFIMHLELLVNEYLNPLQERAETKKHRIISSQEIDGLFGNIADVLKVHQMLLKQFLKIQDKWPRCHGIGKAFTRRASAFAVYKDYVNNFKHAQNIMQACRKTNPKFNAFLEETYQKTEKHMLGLHELIGIPLNRISSYNSLLDQLVRHSTEDSKEARSLESARALMQQMYEAVVTSIENADVRASIMRIENLIINLSSQHIQLAQSGRKFVEEGSLTVALDKLSNPKHKRYTFLFSDLLLLTKKQKQKSGHYKLETKINLYDAMLRDIDSEEVPELVGNKTTFRLDTPLGKFYLSAKSPTDKNRWTTLLRDSTEIRVEKNKVFGRPIEEVLQNDANSAPQGTKVIVPRVLEMCVNYLTKVIETEGIFRVACVNSLLLSLKAQIDTNIDETDLDAVEDPHAISSLLKCYLRELPEPLLTFEFYEKVILPDCNVLSLL
ncbi:Rho guanyl-nucleotide exchange factor [Balamuthia mandrillaris]